MVSDNGNDNGIGDPVVGYSPEVERAVGQLCARLNGMGVTSRRTALEAAVYEMQPLCFWDDFKPGSPEAAGAVKVLEWLYIGLTAGK